MEGTEIIKDKKNNTIAIIIYKDFKKQGLEFFTPSDYSQQMAYMCHEKGKVIGAHTHQIVKRDVHLTQETLFVKSGKLKVNFYDNDRNYFDSRNLVAGDVILLTAGGHGFEVLEDLEMIEIKQGPYLNDNDKVRFKGIEKA
jgi:mannose-6-phosphate isomerase-like protein (cupin superfamily)